MGGRIKYSGLVVAGVGFFLTRFTVTLALSQEPLRFYLAGVVPLVLGLGLAAFGVALAVADLDASFVRTTAAWCVVGTAAMLVLVVLTLLGSSAGGMPDVETIRSRTYLANVLIGGAVGGTLTGLYASHNRRQRDELRHQANRLEVLNRLLRHEVLNSLNAIRGYAGLRGEGDGRAQAVIESHSDHIHRTIEEVRYLTKSAQTDDVTFGPVDLEACLRESVAAVRDEYPEADLRLRAPGGYPAVLATEHVERVFAHLLENAVRYAETDAPVVEVTVTETAGGVRVSVQDEGPGLPETQQRLLETGEIDEFDDPRSGYGLNVVRLLVESYRGSMETAVSPDGTTVTVELLRADDGASLRSSPGSFTGVRPATPQLVVTLGAALVAGVAYGLAAEALGGSVGIIGVLYGVESSVVGWVTHEFHSVVFGFAFAGIHSLAPRRYRDSVGGSVGIATAWALVLWFLAAGVVSAVWLRLLGFPAPVPSLSVVSLGGHLAWGVSLGLLTAVGYDYLPVGLSRFRRRFRPTERR